MPVPGGSNISSAQGARAPLNLSPQPGGALVKAPSQALVPTGQPGALPQVYPKSFAEPPPQPINLLKPLPNLQNLKPPTNPAPQPATPAAPATTPSAPAATPTAPAAPALPVLGAGGSGAATAVAGGTAVGLLVPAALGAAAAGLWAHNAGQLMKLWQLSQPESKPTERLPKVGEDCVQYQVDFIFRIGGFTDTTKVYGPIGAIRTRFEQQSDNNYLAIHEIFCRGAAFGSNHACLATQQWCEIGRNPGISAPVSSIDFLKISRADGQPAPELELKPAPPAPQRQPMPTLSPSPSQSPQLQLQQQPDRPQPLPFAEPEPKKPQIKFSIPFAPEIKVQGQGQPEVKVTPKPPADSEKPLAPTRVQVSESPSGDQQVEIQAPGNQPIKFTSPGSAPISITAPGMQPITYTPGQGQPANTLKPITAPDTLVPLPITSPTIPLQQIKPLGSKPAGLEAESRPKVTPQTVGLDNKGKPQVYTPVAPAKQPATSPTTSPTTQPTTQPATSPAIEKQFKELETKLKEQFDTMLVGLVGATQVLNGIRNNTQPEKIAEAVCKTTEPGGCTANLVNSAATKTRNDILGKLNLTGQGVDLLLLSVIDKKLGAQMPDGLSGGLGRLSRFLGIDRVLNLLNTLVILHNAMMLSSSLKVTLLEMLSSIGNATGLLQTSEGDNVDLNQVFNNKLEGLITHLIGAENFASLKLSWRKYSSIFRATANSWNAVTNMFNSLGEAIETTAEYTGKIGNGLRAAGVVGENAYNFFSEKVTVRTSRFMRFQTKTAGAGEILEAINEVAENVIEGQEQFKEYEENKKKFNDELAAAKKNPGIDNAAIKEEAAKIKENLAKDPSGEDDEGLLSFLTDR